MVQKQRYRAKDPTMDMRVNVKSGVWLILTLAEKFYNDTHSQTLHDAILEALDGYTLPYEPTQQVKLNIPTRKGIFSYTDTVINIYPSDLYIKIDPSIRTKFEVILADARLIDANTDRKRWLEMILHGYGRNQFEPRNTIPKEPPYTKRVSWICHHAYELEIAQITLAMQNAMNSLLSVPVYYPFFQDIRDFEERNLNMQKLSKAEAKFLKEMGQKAKIDSFMDQMKESFMQYTQALKEQLSSLDTAWSIEIGGKLKSHRYFRAFADWQFSNHTKVEMAKKYGFIAGESQYANTFNSDVIQPIAKILELVARE